MARVLLVEDDRIIGEVLHTSLTQHGHDVAWRFENPKADLRDVVKASVATTGRLDRTVTDLLALARDTPRSATPPPRPTSSPPSSWNGRPHSPATGARSC
ncbi:response regulator [Amycolatopsis sp. NPDC023774]|uniref:response regulator n=1 Tax=Amycolatopsis sp. NPDC023774 TaxID=3155015 RepID=UPI0033FAA6BF